MKNRKLEYMIVENKFRGFENFNKELKELMKKYKIFEIKQRLENGQITLDDTDCITIEKMEINSNQI